MKKELLKVYSPNEVEDKWYSYWEENNLFHAEVDHAKEPYTIVIPPPNITGSLTMGHILNNTLQDIFIRWKKMQGYNACWVPGTDHASIATETKVTQALKEKGIDKKKIGREEFLKHCQEWKELYGGMILKQLRKLGVACDWERLRFTMDDDYYRLVIEAFVQLYEKGQIYRGLRMVNWDPQSQSAISDEEVIYQEVNGKLWYFKYPIKESDEFIVVATTRPETMLGDTGVAVNPEDERYKHLIGKKIVLPLVGREIPIFADEYVDKEFGTGCVKVTPAHDPNDFEMSKRHKLQVVNILNPDATLNSNAPGEFVGLDRFEARKKVARRLEEEGFLVKIEDYKTNIGYSERGKVPIEPYLSEQWFMKMDELVKPAIKSVEEGEVKFHPDRWTKVYFHWMNNIRDWCISRQLWWGHRIPVWYCVGDDACFLECKKPIVAVDPPEKCPHCGSKNLRQDEDVLDTWASSWLWAHGVFKTEEERKYFYPTDLLITGPDIIFFWVARMIIAGHEFMNEIPFKDVYFTSIIRDDKGRKMSKSLGNSPDPLEVIDQYGADALRFTVIYLAPLGQDVLFSVDKCEIGRNFANKIWNAGRFLLMNRENISLNENLLHSHLDLADKWILSRLNATIQNLNDALDQFKINDASKQIYNFIWSDYCDWYIEFIKNRINSETNDEIKSAILTRAIRVYENILKLLHPIMPYITEEIWQALADRQEGESIMISTFPAADHSLIKPFVDGEMDFLQNIITSVRNIRGEMNVPPSKTCDVVIKTENRKFEEIIKNYSQYISRLARVENISVGKDVVKPKHSSSAVMRGVEIFVPLEGLIDIEVERERLKKEAERLQRLLDGVNKKLSNESFTSRAPKEVIEKEKEKQHNFSTSLEKIKHSLKLLD
ncbi:MAG: valine--tRNA ligase [Bacteroidetes bacterium]|nr:valine--tRNA ligase [Bacteroidota bacterium]